MGTSMNSDVVTRKKKQQKTADLRQKIDLHHDMGISMNSDVVKKPVDLHQKVDPHHDMDISVNSDVVNKIR